MSSIEIQHKPNFVVLLDNLPHVAMAGELCGFQSYIDIYDPKGQYFIEYFSSNGGITSQYEQKELWENILLKLKQQFYGKNDN